MASVRKHSWFFSVSSRTALARNPHRRGRLLSLEALEDRVPLSATAAYTPDQLREAYGIEHIQFGAPGSYIAGNGSGQTIAIVDSGDDPNMVSDLQYFDQKLFPGSRVDLDTFGSYSGPKAGSTRPWFNTITAPGSNPQGFSASAEQSDAKETSLDVEWAHVIAPMANILLVETGTGLAAIAAAAQFAASQSGVSVVSMSYGFQEPSTTADDADFTAPGVTFLASAGDNGSPLLGHLIQSPIEYPASSPNVVGVGGTTLRLNSDGSYKSETGWSFAPVTSLENGHSHYSQSGTWASSAGGFSGTYSTAAAGSGSTATWTTTIAAADKDGRGFTEVSATWVAAPGNATNAQYTIYDNGTKLATDSVDQTTPPIGTAGRGTFFQELGDFKIATGDTLTVVLSASSANGTVVADAVGVAQGGATGGGISALENKPAYQSGVSPGGGQRAMPDVAFEADPKTGVLRYDTYNPTDVADFTSTVDTGGTSLAAPCWAALIAIADQGLANAGLPTLGSTTTLSRLYNLPSFDFHDITSGYNGYLAGAGYDLMTGLGTPIANQLVIALANVSGPLAYEVPEGQAATHISVQQVGANIEVFDNGAVVASRPVAKTTVVDIYFTPRTTAPITISNGLGGPPAEVYPDVDSNVAGNGSAKCFMGALVAIRL